MSPGSLPFAKLVMMSSAPANLRGVLDTHPKIHSFIQRCPTQSRLQSVLGVRSFYVERNNYALFKYICNVHDIFEKEDRGVSSTYM